MWPLCFTFLVVLSYPLSSKSTRPEIFKIYIGNSDLASIKAWAWVLLGYRVNHLTKGRGWYPFFSMLLFPMRLKPDVPSIWMIHYTLNKRHHSGSFQCPLKCSSKSRDKTNRLFCVHNHADLSDIYLSLQSQIQLHNICVLTPIN